MYHCFLMDYIRITHLFTYITKSLPVCGLFFTSRADDMWLERERDKLYGKHHSSRAPLWLGNKTLRTRWYQVDLPVLLLASSVAWLRNGFLRAERGGVCVWGRPRVCLCERTDASMVPVRVCDQPIVPLKQPDRAGRNRRETLRIYVCVCESMHAPAARGLFTSDSLCMLQ